MRVHQQAAYVLINRPYSETSWIVEVFSREYGRIALMAKGARRIKSQLKGILLPFQPVLLSWTGKGEVPTLTSAEIDVSDFNLIENDLKGDQLVCGFYCNELLVYLLHRYDPHPQLFDQYHNTIIRLYDPESVASEAKLAGTLREFEKIMLKETGYEVSFKFESDGKTPIQEQASYQFQPSQGFVRCQASQANAVKGIVILAMQTDLESAAGHNHMISAKHLMRDILKQSLGYQKINSRELFFPRVR